MQDYPLLLTNVLDYAAKWHNEQVRAYSVSRRLAHVHRSVHYSALNAYSIAMQRCQSTLCETAQAELQDRDSMADVLRHNRSQLLSLV